jgi:hypothetical protein
MPRHRLSLTVIATVATCALAPTVAQAATLSLDQRCYHPGDSMVARGAGFLPNEPLMLGAAAEAAPVTSDDNGAFEISVRAPQAASGGARPADVLIGTLAVSDPNDGTQSASTPFRVANYTADFGTEPNPLVTRTWFFSGFPAGKTIYGHFVLNGKSIADHRFGRTVGACGLLRARARGIAVKRELLRAGKWTIQLDTFKAFEARRAGSLDTTVTVPARRR